MTGCITCDSGTCIRSSGVFSPPIWFLKEYFLLLFFEKKNKKKPKNHIFFQIFLNKTLFFFKFFTDISKGSLDFFPKKTIFFLKKKLFLTQFIDSFIVNLTF